jgi:hypothetical protein
MTTVLPDTTDIFNYPSVTHIGVYFPPFKDHPWMEEKQERNKAQEHDFP